MFDFSCPENELTLRVVDTEGPRKMASQIAVYGCGQKAVYVYFPDTDTWILDGAVSAMPADFEVPPNVTKGKDKKRDDKKAAKAEKKGKMGSSEAAPAPQTPVEQAPVEQQAPADTVPDPS